MLQWGRPLHEALAPLFRRARRRACDCDIAFLQLQQSPVTDVEPSPRNALSLRKRDCTVCELFDSGRQSTAQRHYHMHAGNRPDSLVERSMSLNHKRIAFHIIQ